eukprot:GDKI01044874.1.p1 GENE.GDKI01044874.1~~GDKI01044874.1.p1  ORF type:complete len:180 (+),score=21.42 GDKI01044874.1:66-605(+)
MAVQGASIFGLVIPKRLTSSQFVQQGEAQWITEIVRPGEVSEFSLFLNNALPSDNHGVGVYFSYPPYTDWQYLGLLTNNCPSEIFSTGWALNPEVSQLPAVRLGLMVEPASALMEKLQTQPPLDVKKEFARKTALNLFRFIESFCQDGVAQVIQPAIDRWMKRFDEKYKIDPLFIMKTE